MDKNGENHIYKIWPYRKTTRYADFGENDILKGIIAILFGVQFKGFKMI